MKFTSCTHNLSMPSLLSPQPPPPHTPLHCGSPHLFFHPPQDGWGFFPNSNLERSEWNYLSWPNQITVPISLRRQIWHSRCEIQIQM